MTTSPGREAGCAPFAAGLPADLPRKAHRSYVLADLLGLPRVARPGSYKPLRRDLGRRVAVLMPGRNT